MILIKHLINEVILFSRLTNFKAKQTDKAIKRTRETDRERMWSLSEALLTRDSLCSSSPSSRKKRQEKDESRSGDDMLPHLNLCTDEAAMASPPSHSIQTNLIRGSSLLCKVRVPHRLFAACHATLLGLSLWGAFLAQVYDSDLFWSSSIVAGACLIRILWMISSAFSQAAVASTILAHGFGIGSSLDTQTMPVSDKQCRRQRRVSRYSSPILFIFVSE